MNCVYNCSSRSNPKTKKNNTKHKYCVNLSKHDDDDDSLECL
uniref:Uncharacterized protein n=1 Tax=Anguilla anguilla TaxID=7936 RepID=A0A0E9QG53_ANGAN